MVGAIRGRGVSPIVSTNPSLRLSDERIRELLIAGLGVISLGLRPPFEEAVDRLARVTTRDAASTQRVAWLRARLTAACPRHVAPYYFSYAPEHRTVHEHRPGCPSSSAYYRLDRNA